MPRKRENYEQKFCTLLSKWLKYNARTYVLNHKKNLGPIEAKVSYQRLFNFNSGFKKGQLETLVRIKYNTVVHKISDFGRINARPWDLDCYTYTMPAVALTWKRDNNNVFYLLDPEYLLEARERGDISISEQDAIRICFGVGYLRK